MNLRLVVPEELSTAALRALEDESVSSVQVLRGASLRPAGDVIEANVSREGCDTVVQALSALGIASVGSLTIEPVGIWMSAAGDRADSRTPGASADAVVWPAVEQQALDDSELNFTYVSFMVLAMLIAGIAIELDSAILVIGAMVLGPEFGAIVAIALAVVRRRANLFRRGLVTLLAGFAIAMVATSLATFVGVGLGWVNQGDLARPRVATSFIYLPDLWSIVVSIIAGAAGVLALTSARTGGLSGVFISVTTVPAAANLAMAVALGQWSEVSGSAVQLAVNLIGMIIAGIVTLLIQEQVWNRVRRQRSALRASR